MRHEILTRLLRVGTGLVDLVDGDHDRHFGRLGVIDRLKGLRHHTVVGGHHEHGHVGELRAASTQGGERLMTRGIEEGDLAIANVDLVGADVLGDATRLARHDAGLANCVEQRGLAVVDMTHDRDDGSARLEIGGIVFDDNVVDLFLCALDRDGTLKLGGDNLDCLVGERLRDGHELAEAHHRLDDLGRGDAELLRVLLDGDATGNGDRARRADDNLLFADLAIATTATTALRALARTAGGLGIDNHAALLALRDTTLRTRSAGRSATRRRRRGKSTATRGRAGRASVAGGALTSCSSGSGLLLLLGRLDGLGLDGVGVRGGRIDRLGLDCALGRGNGLFGSSGRLLLGRRFLRLGAG